jgi:Uma2 family endonuclease
MGEPAKKLKYTYAEYLDLDRASEYKLEYDDGEVYPLGEILAMGGGSKKHSRIGARLIAALETLLAQRPCEVHTSDQRIKVLATGFSAYPDVTVVCGHVDTDPDDEETITNPVLLVEVLSKSTERHDRDDKVPHYRRIPSLREYLLVSQREARVEHHLRNADGTWTLRDVRPPEAVRLAIGGEIDVAKLYEDRLSRSPGGSP